MIELIDVWKSFNNEWVLRGVNLEITNSGLFVIVGDNGSGKTTLIKLICGLLKPSKGVIKVFGVDTKKNLSYKSRIGVLLHENILYDELTVWENLEFYAKLYNRKDISDIAVEAFESLGLKRFKDIKVGELSYGWKKRANIVRALINDPEIVLFDEPFSGLDSNARAVIDDLLYKLSKSKTVLITSPVTPEIGVVYKLYDGVLHT